MEIGSQNGSAEGGTINLSPGTDGRFLSLKPFKFRAVFTRRIVNMLTEGEYFFPTYQYALPYLAHLTEEPASSLRSWCGINAVADHLLARQGNIFNNVDNIKTKMRISHIQSLVQNSSDSAVNDNIAGNNSPYLNIGRDKLSMWRSLPCDPNLDNTAQPWSESELHGNTVYGHIHNGGVYLTQAEFNKAEHLRNGVQGFGVQGPYSMFGDVQSLQSATQGSFELTNFYQAPSGFSIAFPNVKESIGLCEAQPFAVPRWPAPTEDLPPFNTSSNQAGESPTIAEGIERW